MNRRTMLMGLVTGSGVLVQPSLRARASDPALEPLQRPPVVEPVKMADPISYFEFAGPDAAGLARFYETVFGWKTAPGPFPNYLSVAADAGAGLAGGFRQEEKAERVLYVRVADLDGAIAKVVAAGGRVLIPPTLVPGVVHFALFEDPQGNRTGLMK